MNPLEPKPDRCTWICHNNTTYCKEHHVQLARPYFDQIDPIYFGMINLLKATGNYGLANIVVFVVVLPLLMFLLLVRSIELELRIRNLKKS